MTTAPSRRTPIRTGISRGGANHDNSYRTHRYITPAVVPEVRSQVYRCTGRPAPNVALHQVRLPLGQGGPAMSLKLWPRRRPSNRDLLVIIVELLEDLPALVARVDLLAELLKLGTPEQRREFFWRVQQGKLPCPMCGNQYADHQEGQQT